MSHAKIIESSFKSVFDLPTNRFESIRLGKWMFSVRGSFIWTRPTKRRQGDLRFNCFGGRLMKRRWSLHLYNVANCKHDMCRSMFELLTVLCADSATSTEGLGGTEDVGADHKSVLEVSKPNNKLTQRRIGQWLSGNCAFKEIERISICDGGALDRIRVEVANHNDSRGAPNTITWRHSLVYMDGQASKLPA